MKIPFSSLRKVETTIFIISNLSLPHRCFNAFHRIVTTQRIRSSLPLYFARFARYINLRSLHAASNRFLPSSTMFIYQFSYTVYGFMFRIMWHASEWACLTEKKKNDVQRSHRTIEPYHIDPVHS